MTFAEAAMVDHTSRVVKDAGVPKRHCDSS